MTEQKPSPPNLPPNSCEGVAEWRMVPVEPTERMLDAGVHACVNASPNPWCPAAYRAMLAAAPDPWQSIDSAPKDGTHVLLEIRHETHPIVGYWHPLGGGWCAEKSCMTVSCGPFCNGGTVNEDFSDDDVIRWTPLPPRPKA